MKSHSATTFSGPTKQEKTTFDRFSFAAFIGGIVFLSVVSGMLMAALDTKPYQLTKNALSACNAVFTQREMASETFAPYIWNPVRYTEPAIQNTNSSSPTGLTLYTAGADGKATLIDSLGIPQHVWDAPYSKVFPASSLAKSMIPDSHINMRRAHVFKNGDLLGLYESPLNTPSGMGLVKLNKNSEVVWSNDINCHHDFAINEEGRIFVLTHQLRTPQHPDSFFLNRLCQEDFVTVLSPEGKVLNEFSLLNLLYDSPYYRRDILKRDDGGDLLHTNTINLVGAEFASNYENVEAGHLMVCFRNIDMVAIVDPTNEQIVWATSGPWHFPHDPDPLDNGNIMIYDNCFDRGEFVGSRVVEFEPGSGQVVWENRGPVDQPMRSDIRATQQLLENGNVLICDSNGGRMFEVTREGKLVWQFSNPQHSRENEPSVVQIMTGVYRYDASELGFLNPLSDTELIVSTANQLESKLPKMQMSH